jgi:hypothetical protein
MIYTVASLHRVRRFQDRRRAKAARILTAMERGATLSLMFSRSGSVFTLSNGEHVAPEIALLVINDLRIISQNDGLFPSLPQSWKHVEQSF